ncbi:hypothetical protein SteCoe_8457 [Stentor coeruleus]|uniref:Uncharacterized protein n=1 Tax=Stentor coeruleus TaxID=5963 RepID=A0A1R2CK48_9CILI|nr:hypothetical protein SteCoe_8457 [Stentor coeruleus]
MSSEEKHKKTKNSCPVNCENVDVMPECYHYSNKCFCFMCTCGQHKCPSLKKSFFVKGAFDSNYSRSYSRPGTAQAPVSRIQKMYRPNDQKMDLKTVYMSEFANFKPSPERWKRSETPQPNYKFEGSSQYSRDFPNWGPVDKIVMKHPVNPIHDTKLKFNGKSSYEEQYAHRTPKVEANPGYRSKNIKHKSFDIPLQTTFQREFQPSTPEHYARHERKYKENPPKMFYNKNQFQTTTATAYLATGTSLKDPMQYMKEIISKTK